GLRDFASHASGARIITSLTSATSAKHMAIQDRSVRKWWKEWKHMETRTVQPPETALMPDLGPTDCWPTSTFSGYLGVQLSEPANITHITIDHIAKKLAPDIRMAPRLIECWKEYIDHRLALIPLGQVEYDIHAETHIQHFPLQFYGKQKFDRVIFHFLDNWGSQECTCIYRVRVH
ncbi:hypothetical protein BD410DRAFT_693823, partial [Rickenella mellea]